MSVQELLNALAPDGVPFKPMGQFAELSAGATPSSEVPEYWEDGTIPWMSSGEVNRGTVRGTDKKITQAAFDSCSTKMLPANVVVMALAGQGKTRGKVARTRIPLCTNQSLAAIVPDAAQVDSDFLYFFLTTQYSKLRDVSSGDGTRGGLNLQMIRSYLVPVPPLEVQREIVRILDRFTELEAELEAELVARRRQYDHYRDQLLAFSDAVPRLSMGELCSIKSGQPVSKIDISKSPGVYPVINSGRDPLGFIDRFNTVDDPIGITSRGAGVGSVIWTDGPFFRGNLNYAATIRDPGILQTRFLYHWLMQDQRAVQALCTYDGIPALNKSSLETLPIPVPSLEEQLRIVKILDKFDALVNDSSIGLPAELAARRKQYEYYRDKLLTFEEAPA